MTLNNTASLLFALAVLLSMTTCATYDVVTFTNSGSDFSNYFSYQLEHLKTKADAKDIKKPNELLRLEKVLHEEMASRKYQQSTSYPDLTLRYELISNQQTTYDVDAFSYRRSFYDPFGYFYNINERTFTESILLLELKDAATAKIVWQGSLDLRYSRRSKQVDDLIKDAVTKIFSSYRYIAGSEHPTAKEVIN